jgi:hypothetical protein
MEEQPRPVCGLIGRPHRAIMPRPSPDGYYAVDLSGVARAVYEIDSSTEEAPKREPKRKFSMRTLL